MSFDRAAYMRAYQAENKQMLREYNAFYHKINKDQIKAQRNARRDELNAYRREHYHKNKETILAQQREYLAKKKSTVQNGNSEAAQEQKSQLQFNREELKNQCSCAF